MEQEDDGEGLKTPECFEHSEAVEEALQCSTCSVFDHYTIACIKAISTL